MGSFAKWMGVLASRSGKGLLESESSHILKSCRANKVPGSLSLALDATLKDGHDMKVFGLGTAASLASLERYRKFTFSMHCVYSEMEKQLDQCTFPPVAELWAKNRHILRRSHALRNDLKDVQIDVDTSTTTSSASSSSVKSQQQRLTPTRATKHYVEAIEKAAETDQGAPLLGHVYCRYFADLFGGQMLGWPTQVALQLPVSPRHYQFDFEFAPHHRQEGKPKVLNRREYIESLYSDLNQSGAHLTKDHFDEVVREAYRAFHLNAVVYAEEPGMVWDAGKGTINLVTGAIQSLIHRG